MKYFRKHICKALAALAVLCVLSVSSALAQVTTVPSPITLLSTNALVGSKALAGSSTPTEIARWKTIGVELAAYPSNGSAAVWCGANKEWLYAYLGVGYYSNKQLMRASGTAGDPVQQSNAPPIMHTIGLRYSTNQAGEYVYQGAFTNIDFQGANYLWCQYITNAGTVADLCLTGVVVKLWPNQVR